MVIYDKEAFYVDFSERENLTIEEKNLLEDIQRKFRPIERADYLVDFRMQNKITADDFEQMTGIPYNFDQ